MVSGGVNLNNVKEYVEARALPVFASAAPILASTLLAEGQAAVVRECKQFVKLSRRARARKTNEEEKNMSHLQLTWPAKTTTAPGRSKTASSNPKASSSIIWSCPWKKSSGA